jgi:hypothetical protein
MRKRICFSGNAFFRSSRSRVSLLAENAERIPPVHGLLRNFVETASFLLMYGKKVSHRKL